MTKSDTKMKNKEEKKALKEAEEDNREKTLDIDAARKYLEEIEENIEKIKHLIFSSQYSERSQKLNTYEGKEGKIVEGFFDGENMIARDNKKYPIPPNYASKSKLVTGDLLKLTITPDGTFLFKQIGPVDRKKIIGEVKESSGRYYVDSENKKYNVLFASITYFKIKPGDKVTIVVPKDEESDWAAIENLIERK